MSNKEFNNRIKELREKKGLSQDQLANLSGLSQRTIQRIEKNETNPLGDTKRKIVKILESYPDADFTSVLDVDEKNDFLKTLIVKYEYSLIVYFLSLLLVSVGLSVMQGMKLLGFALGFLSIVTLMMSTAYHLKIKGFKNGGKYLGFSLVLILFFLSIVGHLTIYKTVSETSRNGITTIIERNHFTGKVDTTIIEDKHNKASK